MKKKIVAVTACTMGISHTYMAAEKLKITGEKLGVQIKVETNGAKGVENQLSEQDIEEARGVIIAADTKIQMDRFIGKRVLSVPVKDGIHRASDLIETILYEELPIYEKNLRVRRKKNKSGLKGLMKQLFYPLYNHLMNGISHALPLLIVGGLCLALGDMINYYIPFLEIDTSEVFTNLGLLLKLLFFPILAGFISSSIADRPGLIVGLVGGWLAYIPLISHHHLFLHSGILGVIIIGFISGYLVNILQAIIRKLPEALQGIIQAVILPIIGVFGITLLLFILQYYFYSFDQHFMEFLHWIDQDDVGVIRLLLGFILAGLMAVDLGGPVNKLTYVIGIMTLVLPQSSIMAAIIAGAMVPPLASTIVTTLFRNQFTSNERKLGRENLIKGLSMITEGGIPFVKAYPKVAPLAFIIGSGIAGLSSMLFHVTSPIPHGGILILPFMNNGLLFCFSIGTGTLISAILFRLLMLRNTTEGNKGVSKHD